MTGSQIETLILDIIKGGMAVAPAIITGIKELIADFEARIPLLLHNRLQILGWRQRMA